MAAAKVLGTFSVRSAGSSPVSPTIFSGRKSLCVVSTFIGNPTSLAAGPIREITNSTSSQKENKHWISWG